MNESNPTERKETLSWLTVEVGLYGLMLALALALRLGGLTIRIMDTPEAAQALQSWHLSHGDAATGSYSPLLALGQILAFSLFGASDVTARLFPALAGSILVLLPYLFRDHLGRVGALSSALIMALSPTLVYSARYGNGMSLTVVCAAALLGLWFAYRSAPRPGFLYAGAVVAGLLLLSDARVIGVAAVLAIAWAIERLAFGRDILHLDGDLAVPWKQLALVAGATLVLGATALTLNPSGLGSWADFITAWVDHLAPIVNGHTWYYPLGALLLYEPMLIVFGSLGALDLIIRKDKASIVVWLALDALALALLAGGRDAGDVALVCALLALAAGRAIENLAESWLQEEQPIRAWLYVLIALGIVTFVTLEASFYSFALSRSMEKASQFLWFWLLSIAMAMLLSGLLVAWYGTRVMWRIGGTTLLLVLLVAAFSATVGLNFRHANDPRELHIQVASDEGIRSALAVLADLSDHTTGQPLSTPLTVEADLGPVWQWYLRDWEDLRVVETLTADISTPLVLADASTEQPALGEHYIGQDFVSRTWWQTQQLAGNQQPRWWLYRKSISNPTPVQRVIVWMQAKAQ